MSSHQIFRFCTVQIYQLLTKKIFFQTEKPEKLYENSGNENGTTQRE